MPLIFPYPVSSGTTFQTGSSPVYIYNGSHWKIDSSNKSTSGTSGSNGSSGTSGLQGPAGQTLTVKGVYSSYSGLTGLTPTNLDTYIVQDTSHLWIYNPSSPSANGAGWVDMGQIQGPKGENGTSGSSGSNGSSGTSGSSGGTGSSGSSGSNGSSGSSGSNGSSGTSGSSGSNGSSGSSGSNGSSGTSGTSGSSGSSGSNGSSGTSGSSGSNGSSGTSGSSGSNGSSGTSGSNGSSGTAGTSGSSGSNGSSGTSGSSGSAGTSGTSGSSGSSGTSGTSGSSGSSGSSGTSGTSGLVTLTGTTAGGLITYNGSGTNATVQSGVTYSGTTLTAPTGSFSNVIVNGQPTTYGVVSPTVVLDTNVVGTSINGGSNTSPALTILTLAIPSAGTWRLDAELRVYVPGGGYMGAAFYDNGTLISGSEYFIAAGGVTQTGAATAQYNGFMSYDLTTTGARTVTVGIWSTTSANAFGSGDGRTWARATLLTPSISIQATATGTLNTDYINAGRITSDQIGVGAGSDVIFNRTIVSSGISMNTSTGVFTLTAGKTYRLFGSVSFINFSSATGWFVYQWVDATTNAALDTTGISVGVAEALNRDVSEFNATSATLIYTPSTNQTVKLRITDGGGTTTIRNAIGTKATIEQIANTFSLTSISGLTTTGDVSVGGNLTVTGTGGNVLTKASGFVNQNVYVTLGNLKVRMAGSGGLQVATVSGTYSVYGSGNGSSGTNMIDGGTPLTITTTPAYLKSGQTFAGAGNTDTWNIMDTSNTIAWRITMIVGAGYNNNMISIERLV
jgi:hypothetical protein